MKATTRSIEDRLEDVRLETLKDKEIALEQVSSETVAIVCCSTKTNPRYRISLLPC
jgi:hypothetical protein